MPNPTSEITSHITLPLVIAQFVLIIAVFSGTPGNSESLAVTVLATVLIIGAIGVAFWALHAMRMHTFTVMPAPRETGVLCTNGPYARVRHPMYSAVILGCLGYCIYSQQFSKWMVLLALIAVLLTKLGLEEILLRAKYSTYSDYSKTTSRLLPGIY